jgi:hypothetical protein
VGQGISRVASLLGSRGQAPDQRRTDAHTRLQQLLGPDYESKLPQILDAMQGMEDQI